ncbi:MAG: T9SS type A sorting domain-containing protein, partial [Flavobacteriales bacterium]
YPETQGSTYEWEVSGGTIVSGQGSSSIEVVFNEVGTQLVSVQETQENGCIANTSVFQVQVSPAVGVDLVVNEGFEIYPNPCTDVLMITFAQPSGNLRLYDMQGRLLIQEQVTLSNMQLDVNTIETGTYLLLITDGVIQEKKRIVVSR